MSKSPPPPKISFTYKELQSIWYDILKESGFNDIEHADGTINATHLRRTHTESVVRDAIESYYNMCSHFLYDYEFKDEFEKTIWTYHSEGLSLREITDTLVKLKGKKRKKDAVRTIVKKLEQKMKERYLQT